MSAFGIFEWRDTRYPAISASEEYILRLWAETQRLRDSGVEAPVVEVVVESCADLFLTQLAGFIAKHGRDLQVLLVMAHGDQEGLMQTVAEEQHVSYARLWDTISATCERLWNCPQPAIQKAVVVGEKTMNVVEEDIGDGAGHGLVVLFGACHAMGSGEAWKDSPRWIGAVVGYSGEPNKRTIEKLFVGLSLNHVENYQVAVDAFRDAWVGGETGLSVIADSLSSVPEITETSMNGAVDPHDGSTDAEEGQLLVWESKPVALEFSRGQTH